MRRDPMSEWLEKRQTDCSTWKKGLYNCMIPVEWLTSGTSYIGVGELSWGRVSFELNAIRECFGIVPISRFILSFFCFLKYLQRLLGIISYCGPASTPSTRMFVIYNFTHQVDTFFPVHRNILPSWATSELNLGAFELCLSTNGSILVDCVMYVNGNFLESGYEKHLERNTLL